MASTTLELQIIRYFIIINILYIVLRQREGRVHLLNIYFHRKTSISIDEL